MSLPGIAQPDVKSQNTRILWGIITALMLFFSGCSGPAAVESPEAIRTVDALYTAVTSRREDLVDEAETRLKTLMADGKLSAEAMGQIGDIILMARNNQWQPAAERLDTFIRQQPAGHRH